MTGGKILDTSAQRAFAHERMAALLAIDAADQQAQTLVVPAAALATALVNLSPTQAENVEHLLDFGVVIVDELTQTTAPEAAATLATAHSSRADLATAHTAYSARSARSWASTYPEKAARDPRRSVHTVW